MSDAPEAAAWQLLRERFLLSIGLTGSPIRHSPVGVANAAHSDGIGLNILWQSHTTATCSFLDQYTINEEKTTHSLRQFWKKAVRVNF